MDTLYCALAREIAERIEQGLYRPGERMPGVRALSGQRGVSVATAVAAYRRLEDDGYIEARQRSGFYVRTRAHPRAPGAAAAPAHGDTPRHPPARGGGARPAGATGP